MIPHPDIAERPGDVGGSQHEADLGEVHTEASDTRAYVVDRRCQTQPSVQRADATPRKPDEISGAPSIYAAHKAGKPSHISLPQRPASEAWRGRPAPHDRHRKRGCAGTVLRMPRSPPLRGDAYAAHQRGGGSSPPWERSRSVGANARTSRVWSHALSDGRRSGTTCAKPSLQAFRSSRGTHAGWEGFDGGHHRGPARASGSKENPNAVGRTCRTSSHVVHAKRARTCSTPD